uniref:Uncharacterized protein n=2 Tax=Pseudomonas TaxID=286 RepID=A0A2L1KEH0_PSEAI|nr:Hypothetical protein [Pseudomonas putida]AVE20730.1 Hypothetical protein [Pseudomonas aeruginosa]QNI17319.1 Hypothetical protein [Pseudomonas sp.]ASU52545.1 Hypothetical protein [Pseudomonas putida]QNI15874.1 Hypothetical protein [Pseudomonas aeruginosa]
MFVSQYPAEAPSFLKRSQVIPGDRGQTGIPPCLNVAGVMERSIGMKPDYQCVWR